MSFFLSDTTTLPAEQQAIWAKCFHPTGEFIDFEKEQIESCVPDHFEEQVRRYPNRLAVKSRSHQLSYQELNQAANRVARAILALHTKGEAPIALLLDQGAPLLAPILGVLKTGNFYVPLDPDYPLARTRYILEDSRAGLIVTNGTNFALATELAENGIQLLRRAPKTVWRQDAHRGRHPRAPGNREDPRHVRIARREIGSADRIPYSSEF